MIELRPYQSEAINLVREKFKAALKIILLVITGGGGKGCIAGYMIHETKAKGMPVVFIAHRKELIKQCQLRIKNQFGVDGAIIMGSEKENRFNLVQIASIQTLQRRQLPPASLVIVDEGHRAIAPEYLKVLEEYKRMGARIIGLTGTPFSANKRRGLNELYEDYVANIKCSELLSIGAVIPIKAYGAGSVSSKGMKTLGGDFRQDDLMRAFDVENVYVNLIYNFEKRAKDKKTIVFCSSVAHSIKCTEAFLNKGYKAMHIDGNTPSAERDKAVEYFRTGQVQILCNCSIACEGLDIPDCEAEILAVATKSKIKYLQCVWRIMRPFPGKEFGILIDMADNYERFADMGILPDGNIEVSLEPETKEESTGVAPVKLCPCCSFMNHASARSCNDCNEEFKKTKKEIQEEEFVELAKENKTRRWKGYKQKDWYKVKTEDLEEFAKVKGYKSFWVTSEKERRKSEHKVIKIINHPWGRKRYYQETSKLERIYYAKKPIDTSEFVFEKEDKMYIVFRYIKEELAINNQEI